MVEQNWWTVIILSAIGGAIGGSISVLIAKMGTILFNVSRAFRWAWRNILALLTMFKIKWRKRRALTITERNLQGTSIRIPTDLYDRSLRVPPTTANSSILEVVTVDYPKWLNDYYVVTALETLSAKRRVVKAKRYALDAWPPRENGYFFRHGLKITSASVEDEVRQLETDSMCMVYQSFFGRGRRRDDFGACNVDDRFECTPYAKTLAYDRSESGTTIHPKESAPPCERCWERVEEERRLFMLVVNLLRNELYEDLMSLSAIQDECAAPNRSGERGPFMESVVSFCVESGISYQAKDAVLEVTKRAVGIFACHCKEQGDGQVDVERLRRELMDAMKSLTRHES